MVTIEVWKRKYRFLENYNLLRNNALLYCIILACIAHYNSDDNFKKEPSLRHR